MKSRDDKNCGCSEEKLELYFDNALPQEKKIQVEQHAAGCPKCSAYLKVLAGLRGSVTACFTTQADEGFIREVMEKVQLKPLPEKGRSPGALHNVIDLLFFLPASKRVFATLAASFLVIVLAVFLKSGFLAGPEKAGMCMVDSVYAPQGNAFVFDTENNVKVVWVFDGDMKL